MDVKKVNCRSCGAPLTVTAGEPHAVCTHCGTHHIVDWAQPGDPGLISFQSVLNRITTQNDFLAAERQLSYLDKRIEEGQAELAGMATAVDTADQEVTAARKRGKRAAQNALAILGLLAVGCLLAWYQVLRSNGSGAVLWLVVAFGTTLGIWYQYRQLRSAKANASARVAAAEAKAWKALRNEQAARQRLDELEVERRECNKTVRNFHFQSPGSDGQGQ
jgi:hypothetical protein